MLREIDNNYRDRHVKLIGIENFDFSSQYVGYKNLNGFFKFLKIIFFKFFIRFQTKAPKFLQLHSKNGFGNFVRNYHKILKRKKIFFTSKLLLFEFSNNFGVGVTLHNWIKLSNFTRKLTKNYC